MDPAEPHFAKAKPPVRLDRAAADYVDVIHTDASGFIRGSLGLIEKVGHVDYYPNGGIDQPGCDQSMVQYISSESGSFFRGVRKFLGCNHIRSHEYFAESINSKCSFTTIACNSYEVSNLISSCMIVNLNFIIRILKLESVSNVVKMVNIVLDLVFLEGNIMKSLYKLVL